MSQTKENAMTPLSLLRKWKDNPRHEHSREDIDAKKASILDKGILQNLVISPSPDEPGAFVVIAGEGRRLALVELAAEGKIPQDYPVRTYVVPFDAAEALKIALIENMVREQMKPIDESAAMAKLVAKGVSEDAIAEAFGISTRTVTRRLALGRLVPEAQEIIRNDERDLAWGAAMAAADAATQLRIVADIRSNPDSWKTGHDVNRMLTADTIPVEHALFEMADYQGPVVQTLFEGDFFSDRAEFWRNQDRAIEEQKGDLAAEGFKDVVVLREPLQRWRYGESDVVGESIAVVEVLSNGKVTIHRGLVPIEDEAEATQDLHEVDGAALTDDELGGDYVGSAVRPTPVLVAHCAAARTLAVQKAVAENRKVATALAVAGLIGERQIGVRGEIYRHTADLTDVENDLVQEWKEMQDALNGTLARFKGADVLSTALAMDEAELDTLFCRLVAMRVGQPNPRRIDEDQGSVLNQVADATGLSFPVGWRPDKSFLTLMNAVDLRRIAEAVLPARCRSGIETANKRNLVRLLCDAFDDAWNGRGLMSPEERRTLMEWRPGLLAYPAMDERFDGNLFVADAESEDPFAAIFSSGATEEAAIG